MAVIYIDDRPYEVNPAHNLLQACLSLGLDLPYFCWHPALGSVGACRQCAVKQFKDENDSRGRIIVACLAPAEDGTRISIADPEASEFRASIIEWLMINHPHDCPVCEEGGECHLQDMTLMSGHIYRRYRFTKRTFQNQYLGPFINHEMNRCITCYRCIRFYRDYAGGHDLQALASHDHVYFGRHRDGILENEFSGNLVEVCPTGVFTDKTLSRHYVRKWDLQSAPSICPHCSLGCNTSPGERYGRLRRILNRYHGEINGYFLCDRGRFGYDYVNHPARPRRPWRRRDHLEEYIEPETALNHLKDWLGRDKSVLGIGSPRASLEANFALRTLVGAERFYTGLSSREQRLVALIRDILIQGPARPASLNEVEQADAILILGEDVSNTAPRLALALRQAARRRSLEIADRLKIPHWQDAAVRNAAQQQCHPLFILSPAATRLDDEAIRIWRGTPDDLARLGFAVAHALDPAAPAVPALAEESKKLAQDIAAALQKAKRPLVVCGSGCQSEALLQAAANVAWALCDGERQAKVCFALPECNSLGVGLLGGGDLHTALETLQSGQIHTLLILENDLYRRAQRSALEAAFARVEQIVLIDQQRHATARRATLMVPAASFAESQGSLINNEGRAQRFFPVFTPEEGSIRESWRWLQDIGTATGRISDPWPGADALIQTCAATFPHLRGLSEAAPAAAFRIDGQKIPRQPHRYSGRTAMHADHSIHEPRTPQDPDSPLAFSMEGYPGQPPGALIPFFWAPSWNSSEALNKFQDEVAGPLRGGDPGILLSKPQQDTPVRFFDAPPAAFRRRDREWLLIPLYHIFGSEELSLQASAIAERAPAPYLALHPADRERLQIPPGGMIAFQLSGIRHRLPVLINPSLTPGSAALPVGLADLTGLDLPAWVRLERGDS